MMMSLNNKTNLGWHFYQNYFVLNNGSLMDLTSDTLKKDSTELIFKKKNKEITETAFDISYFNDNSPSFDLHTTYPGLLLGSGYGHEVSAKGEFKLGFFFDYTTGLPIIPGSSIKGVIRSVFPDFKEKENGWQLKNEVDKVRVAWLMRLLDQIDDTEFLKNYYEPVSLEKVSESEIEKWIKITLEIFEGVKDISIKKNEERFYTIYERDIFHDAVLKSPGKSSQIVGEDSLTPHIKEGKTYEQSMLSNPTPLPFMKVLPGVCFAFKFDVKNSSIETKLTAKNKLLLFQKILLTIGIGAKTNVGYGQFSDGNSQLDKEGNRQPKADTIIEVPRSIVNKAENWSGRIPTRPNTFIEKVQAEVTERSGNLFTVKFNLNDVEYSKPVSGCPSSITIGNIILIKMAFDRKGNPVQISFNNGILN